MADLDINSPSVDRKKVTRVASRTSSRLREIEKPGPVTIYQPEPMRVRPHSKAPVPPMSTPKVLVQEDTEAGKKRATKERWLKGE